MHAVRRQRLLIVVFIVFAASAAAGLVVYALSDNMNLFYPPTEISAGKAPIGKRIRAGGMVKQGSVVRANDSLKVKFIVTDYQADLAVEYEGMLPDLFSEDEGVVVAGQLNDEGVFIATEVLAKHDENYMPPEVADTLKEQDKPKMKAY